MQPSPAARSRSPHLTLLPPSLAAQDAMAPRSQQELEALAAKEGYGRLFSAFSSVADGLAACDAVDSLVDASAIDTLLSNFIVPLQSDDISKPDPSGGTPARPAGTQQRRERGQGWSAQPGGTAALRARCLRAVVCNPAPPAALQACTVCTARSTSTPRQGGCRRGGPTCRTNRHWRRTATRWVGRRGWVLGRRPLCLPTCAAPWGWRAALAAVWPSVFGHRGLQARSTRCPPLQASTAAPAACCDRRTRTHAPQRPPSSPSPPSPADRCARRSAPTWRRARRWWWPTTASWSCASWRTWPAAGGGGPVAIHVACSSCDRKPRRRWMASGPRGAWFEQRQAGEGPADGSAPSARLESPAVFPACLTAAA